ncbi:POU domain, class 2, transcription factor 2 [Notechis scutatus]|uniref:POU domain, class 2, transcription factor 1 n=1 Tax=Notechis scutatus TaxID=8663 RepID=A0A6J1V3A4_9SAUR|nr:POU domain, class 2, transcription factor 2 [Notechis scutatus]
MVNSGLWATEVRMSKPLELEKVRLELQEDHTDTERNGPDTNHQTQQSKPSPFSPSPTITGTKIKAEDSTEMPPAPAPAPAPAPQAQQPHLPQAQLMLAGSQLAGLTALMPAQQQLLLQQAQAQLLAAAVQQSNAAAAAAASSQQTGAELPAAQSQPQAPQLALSQPIQLTAQAKDGKPLLMWPNQCFSLFLCIALASGGSLPITSLDASGNLVLGTTAGTTGSQSIVTSPLFLNHAGLPLLSAAPGGVGLVSAAAAVAASMPSKSPTLTSSSSSSSSSSSCSSCSSSSDMVQTMGQAGTGSAEPDAKTE